MDVFNGRRECQNEHPNFMVTTVNKAALPILIIDDDPFIGEYLRDRLEAMGYHVIVARDGRTGGWLTKGCN